MWTKRRWPLTRLSRFRLRRSPEPQGQAGFTLIELLVVIAIIALLLSILLPSLSTARSQAKAAVCATQMRGLASGLATYTADNHDWLPGVNTTGVELRAQEFNLTAATMHNPHLPVQPHDWATPILRLSMVLPQSRAERMRLITERYMCPAQANVSSALYHLDECPDQADFLNYSNWTALSLLMPVHFQYWGKDYAECDLAPIDRSSLWVKPQITPEYWEVQNDAYRSRLTQVGNPCEKVFLADGTRYLSASTVLNHDVFPLALDFGSYASAGAWWSGSTAYGVASNSLNWDKASVSEGSPSEGCNLSLSYRHGLRGSKPPTTCHENRGSINAAFFDGHVERLSDQESRKIDLWYPSGGAVAQPDTGMTAVPEGCIIR